MICLNSWLYDENNPFSKVEAIQYYDELRKDLEEGYFEGINVYLSFFNKELVNILDYFNEYIVIFDALITIPLGLYLCKKQCTKLSTLDNHEEQLLGYKKAASMRILLVGNTMVFAIAAFYLMGAYQSMLWVAAVSAIGWYFTKPSERKMELELQAKDPNQENY